VPDLVGVQVDDAVSELDGLGLSSTTPSEASADVPEGHVIRHAPPGGDLIPAGGVVELVISREPGVVVPSLSGDYDTVANAILALGLEPVRRPVWSGAAGSVNNVVALDPPPGSRLPRGSPVHVAVNAGPWLSLGVDYEDNIHLRGVDLAADVVPPGGVVTFVAHWEAVGEVEGDYAARAVLMSDGDLSVSEAELPLADRPANSWQLGERVSGGRFNLPIDPAAEVGDYKLWFEVYRQGSPDERLAVRSRGFAGRVSDARILLREITVE
jgi:hypothetical protein